MMMVCTIYPKYRRCSSRSEGLERLMESGRILHLLRSSSAGWRGDGKETLFCLARNSFFSLEEICEFMYV